MKNLLINASLVNPPTSILAFRDLTFFIHYDYRHIDSIVLECEKELWDVTWKYLKKYGGFDYIYDFVRPEDREIGLRISDIFEFAPTIQAAYVNEKNLQTILRAVSYN